MKRYLCENCGKEISSFDGTITDPCLCEHPNNNLVSFLKNRDIELLESYSMFLTKEGYMDTDWKDEEPKAIDEFLKQHYGKQRTS